MKYSSDPNCRKLYQHRLARDQEHHYGRGRRTSPCLQLESLEADTRVHLMVGNAQSGRRGLGYHSENSSK